MRVGLECSLHKRARKWGGASMGSRSRNFYSDSDLNFLKSIIYIMASNACMLNTIPAFVQVTIGKVTASLECSLHTGAMCEKCTVPWMRRCKMSLNLIEGSYMQTGSIWITKASRKLAEKCQVKNSMEDGQCGDLEGSLRWNYQRLVSLLFPSIVR